MKLSFRSLSSIFLSLVCLSVACQQAPPPSAPAGTPASNPVYTPAGNNPTPPVGDAVTPAAASASTGGAMPEWAKTASHPQYPKEKFLIGLGIGDGANPAERATRAVQRARSEIASVIRTRVTSSYVEKVTSQTKETLGQDGKATAESETHSAIEQNINAFTDEVLKGAKECGRWEGPDQTYVFMAVAIATLVDNLKEDFDRLGKEARQAFESAKSTGPQSASAYLAHLVKAHDLVVQAGLAQEALLVFTQGYQAKDDVSLDLLKEIREALVGFTSAFRIDKAAGDGQRTLFDKGLEPLEVKLSQGGQPTAQLPVSFRFLPKEGKKAEDYGQLDAAVVRSDAQGLARGTVHRVKRTGERENRVSCSLAYAEISKDHAQTLERLFGAAGQTEFTYFLPSVKFTRIVCAIDETHPKDWGNDSETVVSHYVAGGILNVLREAGFAVYKPKATDRAGIVAEVTELSKKDLEYGYFLIDGEVRLTDKHQKTGGKNRLGATTLDLVLKDARTGATLDTIALTGGMQLDGWGVTVPQACGNLVNAEGASWLVIFSQRLLVRLMALYDNKDGLIKLKETIVKRLRAGGMSKGSPDEDYLLDAFDTILREIK